MVVRVVRLGDKRAEGEGMRIGTVRHPPRGVPKSEFAAQTGTTFGFPIWLPPPRP